MKSRLLPAILLAACASKDERAAPTVQEPGKIVAEAELGVGRTVGETSPPAVLLELKPLGTVPSRLRQDLDGGHGWLRVERPRGFSFAGQDLLQGKGPFRPASASFLFVQPRDGSPTVAEPGLLRLGGRIEAAAVASRIDAIQAPEETAGDGELARMENVNVRVLLGHGVDVLLQCVGSDEMDTHHWIRVVDGEGKPADWQPALRQALVDRNLGVLAPYRVLIRRRHPGDPVPSHYRVRLDDVIVAAQTRLVPKGDTFEWIWEGVWSARLVAPAPEGPPAWPESAPTLQVRYKEYDRPSGDVTGAFFRTLLAPLALGADVGMAFLEGDKPLVDSVAERQRARN